MNLAQIIERGHPDHPALCFEDASWSYRQLDALASQAAARLAGLGIQAGDRVALLLDNRPAFLFAYFGTLKLGAVAVAINAAFKPGELRFILEDCGARALVAGPERAGDGLPPLVRIAADRLERPEVPPSPEFHYPPLGLDADTPAALLYTSGTTGFPKGTVLSHGALLDNVRACADAFALGPHDQVLLCLPLFHCFGQNAALNPCLHAGATLRLHRQFDPEQVARDIGQHRASVLFGTPPLYGVLRQTASPAALRSLRLCVSAAARLPESLAEDWRHRYGQAIHQGYGLTETGLVCFNPVPAAHPGSAGRPLAGVALRVLDERGDEVAAGEAGELAIRVSGMPPAYWNQPTATAEAGQEGWFRSGDLGRIDQEGFVYLLDRAKDMVNVGGLKAYPSEVERALLAHPAVAEAAVYAGPDPLLGEQVRASVVLRPGQAADFGELLRFCRPHLADFKLPAAVEFVDALPKDRSGKVLKRLLRERALSGPPGLQETDAAGTGVLSGLGSLERQAAIAAWLVNCLACHPLLAVPREAIGPERPFADYGMKSLHAVQLARELGEWLERPLSPVICWSFPHIAALARHLSAAAESRRPNDAPAPGEGIAVVGMACRFPGGAHGPEAFWRLLSEGREATGPIPAARWDHAAWYDPDPDAPGKTYVRGGSFLDGIDGFDARFFGLAPREADSLDPQQRLLLEVGWEALEHAGIAASRLQGEAAGCSSARSGTITRPRGCTATNPPASTATGCSASSGGFTPGGWPMCWACGDRSCRSIPPVLPRCWRHAWPPNPCGAANAAWPWPAGSTCCCRRARWSACARWAR